MSEAAEEKQEELNPEEVTEEKSEEGKGDEEEEINIPLHLHTKTIPTIVMLFGGGAAAIFTFVRHDELLTSLEIIFVALVVFLVIGDLIKLLLDRIQIEVPEENSAEKDKVIERSTGEEAGEALDEEGTTPQPEESPEQVET